MNNFDPNKETLSRKCSSYDTIIILFQNVDSKDGIKYHDYCNSFKTPENQHFSANEKARTHPSLSNFQFSNTGRRGEIPNESTRAKEFIDTTKDQCETNFLRIFARSLLLKQAETIMFHLLLIRQLFFTI